MHLDFWNNPILVSALRVRYRRGNLTTWLAVYVAALGLLGVGAMTFNQFQRRPKSPAEMHQILYVGLLAIQGILSAILTMANISSSMQKEVNSGTLDFQRLALPPERILFGKLLGEGTVAYLMILASLPLAIFCWMLGVPGLSLPDVFVGYVALTTTALMAGALGMLLGSQNMRGQGSGGWARVVLVVSGCSMGANVLVASATMLNQPLAAAAIGLPLPLPYFVGLVQFQDIWHYDLPLFGLRVPLVLVGPPAQLAIGALCLLTMTRRLRNPVDPAFTKPQAYGILLAIDLLVAALMADGGRSVWTVETRVAIFWLFHLAASLWLGGTVTPDRELVLSWAWRFRDRTPRWLDALLYDRSPNGLVLLVCCGIGLAVYGLLLLGIGFTEGFGVVTGALPVVVASAGVTLLLVLSLGSVLQWSLMLLGREGWLVLLFLLFVLDLLLHVTLSYLKQEALLGLCPSACYLAWLTAAFPKVQPLLLVPIYGVLFVATRLSILRGMRGVEAAVDRKLREMGAMPAEPGTDVDGPSPAGGVVVEGGSHGAA